MHNICLLSYKRQVWMSILYNYCTWTRSIWGFMEQSTTILNEAKSRVQYCCTLLHKTSYWSSSSVVIVLLHTALFYSNFEIFMKTLKFLKLFENFIILNFFEILWNFWNFVKIWNFKKKIEILRNFWNFKIKKKNYLYIFIFLFL